MSPDNRKAASFGGAGARPWQDQSPSGFSQSETSGKAGGLIREPLKAVGAAR